MNQILAKPAEILARGWQILHYIRGIVEGSRVRPSERGARASGRKEAAMPNLKSFSETHRTAFSKLTTEQKARIQARLSSSEEVLRLNEQSKERYDKRHEIDKCSETEFQTLPTKKPLK